MELDSFRCAKLCREAGLLAPGGGLTAQELVRAGRGGAGWPGTGAPGHQLPIN